MLKSHFYNLVSALIIIAATCMYSCSNELEKEILGAWRSNRDLTVGSVEKSQTLSEKQKKFLFDPNFFGHLVHIYYENEAITIYEGQCSKSAYKIVREGENYVDIESYDSFLKKDVTTRVYIEDDVMWLRINEDLHEYFTRVDIDELIKDYDCLKPLIKN